MLDHTLIRRYVVAIHGLAAQAGLVARVHEELARLQLALTSDPRPLAVIRHPGISADEKRELLVRLTGKEPSAPTLGFIDVLLQKERTEVLVGAADAFAAVADEAQGVVRARVEVAWEPDADQRERLTRALSALVGAPVVAEYSQAPDVIGGARVRVAGRVIDGSLDGRLTELTGWVAAAE
jgi:F-type H+-transporting ATPase subunit delta